ncbi:MAG: ParB/RepB/Spo0J family partition protein [Gallionella sp.]|jgi:ParB family chromosome partitioning protein|nr:ParB/RepB/Spo0J family partition protein [Gallionella sp.]
MATKPLKGLGRGLEALLSSGTNEKDDVLRELNVNQLKPGKYQPRTRIDEASLAELAASIKVQGVMQPILARQLPDGSHEIIAGERRWRAAQLAGLTHVPVLIRSVQDNAALAMALIENIQRENLNPLEEAIGIQRLIDEFGMTHQTAADAVGRSRSAASNLLRLLKLPESLQDMLMKGVLDMGHARALLPLDGAQQILLANKIVLETLSVREVETLAQAGGAAPGKAPSAKESKARDRDVSRMEEELSAMFGTRVMIRPGRKGQGSLQLQYHSHEHLDDLLQRLKRAL